MTRKLLPMLLLLACGGDDDTEIETDTDAARDPYDVPVGPYEVEIRTTSYGIPHIRGEDEGSVGFGLGVVWARNHVCTLADQILKVRSERSRYFGVDHVDSDFGWLHLGVRRQAEAGWYDLSQAQQERIVGVAAGYNHHLAEVGLEGLPVACRGAEWVKPVDHIDLYSYYLSLAQWGSGYNLVELVGQAQPPTANADGSVTPVLPPPDIEVLEPVREPPIGSNGWAIGAAESSTDGGMLLSNTHFPMTGERQWMEFQLTIPGELDVYGVGLVGMPLVAMGFNDHVAWTHTVSSTPRFTPYLLRLGGDRVSYEVDGETRRMEATDYAIQVRQADGNVSTSSRTLYSTEWGPMWNAPVVGWGLQAMTYRDVNWNQQGTVPNFDGMDRATDLESFRQVHREHQGIPWVHTMMADAEGNALYMDSAATPNLSSDAWDAYLAFRRTNLYASQFADFGLVVLDGSTGAMAWTEDDRAARPGAIPFDDVPQLVRDDHVSNANQNHWMANPEEPLTGYAPIYGDTASPRTPRTRMNNFYLEGRGTDPEIGDDGVWTLEELEAAALSMRSSVSELLRDDVVERCQAVEEPVDVGGEPVDVGPACEVLAAWDGRANTDSVGAHIWREFLSSGTITPDDLLDAGTLFAMPFDVEDPIGTPHTLVGAESDVVAQALARSVLDLRAAGLDLDASLGEVQYRPKDTLRIPTPGGYYFEGYIAIATWSGGGDSTLLPRPTRSRIIDDTTSLTVDGYPVANGNSWVMALQFTDDGPVARAVMTYSQSEDPESPWFVDQTELYATQRMRPILYREADIAADPNLVEETLAYP